MKSILTILTDPAIAATQIPAAAAFATGQGGHLHVLALSIYQVPVTYSDLGGSVAIAQAVTERAVTETKELGAAARAALGRADPALGWSVEESITRLGDLSATIGGAARLADVVVALRPTDTSRQDELESVLEAAMFDSRAPVLLLPANAPSMTAAPASAVIAWNESSEAAAAIRGALPLLVQAKSVSIAMIAPPVHDADQTDPGAGLSKMLSRHGIAAEVAVLPRTMPRVSDVILRHVQDREAGLLVMGAYGHSHLREALFGGATRDILKDCPVPVLLAH